MTEPKSENVIYHPEIEVQLGTEFGIDPQLDSTGEYLVEDSAATLEIQPFVIPGIGRGRLKLLELDPDENQLGGEGTKEFPAGNALPLIFSVIIYNLAEHHGQYLTVKMRYQDSVFSGINYIDEYELRNDGFTDLKVWQWTEGQGPCQPIYPPIEDIIREVRFSVIRNS